jgi:hypothetical protein
VYVNKNHLSRNAEKGVASEKDNNNVNFI